MSIFDVHIPSLNLRVVAADGQDVDAVAAARARSTLTLAWACVFGFDACSGML